MSLIAEQAQVQINGEAYTLRRLSVRDTFAVAKIIASSISRAGRSIASLDMDDPTQAGMMVIASIPYAEDEVIALCASLLGVEAEEFAGFPAEAVLDVIEALIQTEDMRSFLSACKRLASSPAMAQLWQTDST